MKYKNYMKLEFPSKNVNKDFACSAVAEFAAQLDHTFEELNDIKTALFEAISNCVNWAYPERIGVILIQCGIIENNTLEIVVKDKGVGIENADRARQPFYTTGGSEYSGMGFTVMENFMTSITVKSTLGEGTVVRMRKHIVPRR